MRDRWMASRRRLARRCSPSKGTCCPVKVREVGFGMFLRLCSLSVGSTLVCEGDGWLV